MTGWNLPPGVNESDIPGNRPEDVRWQQLAEEHPDWTDEQIEAAMDEEEDYEEEPDWDSMPGGADDYDAFRGSEVDDC